MRRGTLRCIQLGATQDTIVIRVLVKNGQRRIARGRQNGAENVVARTKARRAHVGKVVGYRVQRFRTGHQPGAGCVVSTAHRVPSGD